MSEFDKEFERVSGVKFPLGSGYYSAFSCGCEAGAQSRQAEIDCLKVELNGANERALMLLNHKNNMVDKMQAEIDKLKQALKTSLTAHKCVCLERDELQARIDEAMEILEYNEYVDSPLQALDILKGKNHE